MASVKMTQNNSNNVLNDMKNNVGTSRSDEYYFCTNEINVKDLRDLAFKKNLIISVVQVDEYASKMNFITILS